MQVSSTSSGAVAPQRYDFRDISPKDLLATINDLIKQGEMDLDETSPLIGIIPNPMSALPLNMTSPTAFTDRIDVFARLQTGIDTARYYNDRQAERFWQSAVSALERFQGRPIGLDVTA